MNKTKIKLYIAISLLIASSFSIGWIVGTRDRNLEVNEGINMTGRTGMYYIGKDVYCVKVSGRTAKEIGETESHEYCHYLIDKDFNHFCTEEDWK